jgi:CubicO group peptidase (beta-lactamase class C family)
MTAIVEPTRQQLAGLVDRYLEKHHDRKLAFVVGDASPSFGDNGGIYYAGSGQNQFGTSLTLDGDTLFEIASISKTFTATLYALLIRSLDSSLTVGDYLAPTGPLSIGRQFAPITLDQLVNYTSGLPADNDIATDVPDLLPCPYSETGMLSYLDSPDAPTPGTDTSPAGVFVLANASHAYGNYLEEAVVVIAHTLLFLMQGQPPPADTSGYRSADLRRR